MKHYQRVVFQFVELKDKDVITSSPATENDNVGGANNAWDGWGQSVQGGKEV